MALKFSQIRLLCLCRITHTGSSRFLSTCSKHSYTDLKTVELAIEEELWVTWESTLTNHCGVCRRGRVTLKQSDLLESELSSDVAGSLTE